MSATYQLGGSATINGIIMINMAKGRVVRGTRDQDGTVSLKSLRIIDKAVGLYKGGVESKAARIPLIRELLKLLLMLVITVSMFAVGLYENVFTNRKAWTFKSIISAILLVSGLLLFIFADDLLSVAAIVILLIYFHKEIIKILKYHGAEHKCINMYESGSLQPPFSPEAAAAFPRTHARCGTNIVALLVPLGVIYYFAIEKTLTIFATGNLYGFIGSLLILGISVELFRLFQKPLLKHLLKPGILLQKYVTTREPDITQLEVAVKALEAVL